MNNSKFISINYKEALSLIDSGKLKAIGANRSQINNQGEYSISADNSKLYKRRHTANKSIFDLIAHN